MTEHPALEKLRLMKPHFSEYGMKRVRVFGSVVRGMAKPGSDLDLLIDFFQVPSLFDLGGLKSDMERQLGMPVDISMPETLIPELRDIILREALDV
jgi:predicted nucleotidyltransferase